MRSVQAAAYGKRAAVRCKARAQAARIWIQSQCRQTGYKPDARRSVHYSRYHAAAASSEDAVQVLRALQSEEAATAYIAAVQNVPVLSETAPEEDAHSSDSVPPSATQVSIDAAAAEHLSPEELVAFTRAACIAHLKEHLSAFMQQAPRSNYEDWIADLHPENTQHPDSATGIDPRFYIEQSEHLQLWNAAVGESRRVVARSPEDLTQGTDVQSSTENARRSLTGLNIRKHLAEALLPSRMGTSLTGLHIRENLAEAMSPRRPAASRPVSVSATQYHEYSPVDRALIRLDNVLDALTRESVQVA